jgi:hypothetical protein
MTSASPSGSTSVPGSRSPAATSTSRPQPNASPARTSGKTTQATRRASVIPRVRRDRSSRGAAPASQTGRRPQSARRSLERRRRRSSERSLRRPRCRRRRGDALLARLLREILEHVQRVRRRVRADDRVVGAPVADLDARRQVADVDAPAGRPGQLVGLTRARPDPVDRALRSPRRPSGARPEWPRPGRSALRFAAVRRRLRRAGRIVVPADEQPDERSPPRGRSRPPRRSARSRDEPSRCRAVRSLSAENRESFGGRKHERSAFESYRFGNLGKHEETTRCSPFPGSQASLWDWPVAVTTRRTAAGRARRSPPRAQARAPRTRPRV